MKRRCNLQLTTVSVLCSFLLIGFICEQGKYWQLELDVEWKPVNVHSLDHHTLKQVKPHTNFNFTIKSLFSLPVHMNYTWTLKKVLQSSWVSQLQTFASDIGSLNSPINLIASDFIQRHLVLNWLITAQLMTKEPLQNILVISIDSALNHLLESHGIPSIYVPPQTILKSIPNKHDLGFPLQMVRLTVMRLLCHWGVDVAHYDPEAVILKNPHKLYNRQQQADVIGSFASFPAHHFEMWQAALCVGSWMVRSTPATGIQLPLYSTSSYNHLNQSPMSLLFCASSGDYIICACLLTWLRISLCM